MKWVLDFLLPLLFFRFLFRFFFLWEKLKGILNGFQDELLLKWFSRGSFWKMTYWNLLLLVSMFIGLCIRFEARPSYREPASFSLELGLWLLLHHKSHFSYFATLLLLFERVFCGLLYIHLRFIIHFIFSLLIQCFSNVY